jgi:aryl-alcohol dehydrogenase-like predicted oxidoreductase
VKYSRLGQTGLKVSQMCLGCMTFGKATGWMVDSDEAKKVLGRAWDLGINYYDTANVYNRGRSEEILGEFVKGRRDEAVVATKVYFKMGNGPNQRGLSSKHVHWQLRESLRRLGTDYVDLYQIHRWDDDTPIDETLSVLNGFVREGTVRYIGASAMWAWQFAKALYTSDMKGYARFVSMQNMYNLLYREEEREMNPLCAAEGVAIIPYGPTAAGVLSGRYLAGGRITASAESTSRITPGTEENSFYVGKPANDEIVKRVVELAASKGVKPAQIAIAWLLHKGVTAPIVGTSRVDHLEEFVQSLEVSISPSEAMELEAPYVPQTIMDHT